MESLVKKDIPVNALEKVQERCWRLNKEKMIANVGEFSW